MAQRKHDIERFWEAMDFFDAAEPVVKQAGDLAEQHALRGYDAIHLATALASGADLLVTADRELIRSGTACGLQVLDARN